MPSKEKSAEKGIKMISGWELTVGIRADNATFQQKNPTLGCKHCTLFPVVNASVKCAVGLPSHRLWRWAERKGRKVWDNSGDDHTTEFILFLSDYIWKPWTQSDLCRENTTLNFPGTQLSTYPHTKHILPFQHLVILISWYFHLYHNLPSGWDHAQSSCETNYYFPIELVESHWIFPPSLQHRSSAVSSWFKSREPCQIIRKRSTWGLSWVIYSLADL